MIENGTNKPTVQQLEVLSSFFDVSIDYLVTGLDVYAELEKKT
jgi:transcriptional regulator with XRE-family HTH domain